MVACDKLISSLECGAYDAVLTSLYTLNGLSTAKERTRAVVQQFHEKFGGGEVALFRAPGRTEIGGNHTDHQHGCVLCSSVDLDVLACAAPNGIPMIRIRSEGYPDIGVDLLSLQPCKAEVNTSAALVRGIAAKVIQMGYDVGGFDACVTSAVPPGSGMSSSAAFEVLIGNVINHFFCKDALDAIEIAKIGQYAENVYFGKPCGLMDQMASSVGGVVSIDFVDPNAPIVRKVNVDFSRVEHTLCIVDTGSCHADLTEDYAGITREMSAVAAYFGKTVLRDISEHEFYAAIPRVRERCGDRAVLRAIHFLEENARAKEEAEALERGEFDRLLMLVNQSGASSALHLQNTWSASAPKQQAIPLALAMGRKLLGSDGAIRVHGGGFAGTIQAFVPDEKMDIFVSGMEEIFGKGACRILCLCQQGGCVVIE